MRQWTNQHPAVVLKALLTAAAAVAEVMTGRVDLLHNVDRVDERGCLRF